MRKVAPSVGTMRRATSLEDNSLVKPADRNTSILHETVNWTRARGLEPRLGSLRTAGHLAAAVALAACVRSGNSVVERPPVSKAAFVRAADQACATAEGRLTALWEPGWRAALAKKAVYWRGALPIYRDLVEGLRSLTPPEADRALVEDLWNQLEVAVDRFSLAQRSAEAGDEGGYMMSEIGGFERLMDVRWVATKYGLRICGLKQPH